MWDLVGNPEDQFSHNEDHITGCVDGPERQDAHSVRQADYPRPEDQCGTTLHERLEPPYQTSQSERQRRIPVSNKYQTREK